MDNLGVYTPESDLQALESLADVAGGSGCCVEVGSWAGTSALRLSKVFDRVYCVDHFLGNAHDELSDISAGYSQEDVFGAFCRNVGSKLMNGIYPCVGTSRQWAAVWQFQVDLVFLDAEHTYEAVSEDIRVWLPHVKTGGILCGHDYTSDFPMLAVAVQHSFGRDFSSLGRIWWHRVK